MPNDLQIYLLDPQQYSPETIAVAFAKTSRSPESFRQIAAELNEVKSAEFNEKWVVGYGHSSVAEHAVLHIAVENISRLATECLQSNRLASYTEKSTRYQTWDTDAYLVPEEFANSSFRELFTSTCQLLLDTYQKFIPVVCNHLKIDNPGHDGESETAYERRIRSMATDVCRFLLPAAVLANVGLTINARALEHAVTKMLSHPLAEVRAIGMGIKQVATEQVPTLLKYADADEYLQCEEEIFALPLVDEPKPDEWCALIHQDADAENRILAGCLFKHNTVSYAQSLAHIQKAGPSEKMNLAKSLLTCGNKHTIPLRELEHASFSFEVTVDQGAFYEVKRHRMMTLTTQPLNTDLGYTIPLAIEKAGLLNEYRACMETTIKTYNSLRGVNHSAASYVIPNAFNRRFMITANLRSLVHFIKLRTAGNAHFSVRRLSQRIHAQLSEIMPTFAPFIVPSTEETVEKIENDYFFQL